jgi:arylsulfatase A
LSGAGDIDRDAIYWHYPHYNEHPNNFPSGAIRAGEWKLIESFETGKLSLYDLGADISETRDLAESESKKVAELHARLRHWRDAVGADPMRPNTEYKGKRHEDNQS